MGEESKVLQLLKEINCDISLIKAQNQDIVNQVTEVKNELKNLKTEFATELNYLREENKHLIEENKQLIGRLNNIERKTKKFNIVIYGLNEKQPENTLEEVFDLIQNKFSLHPSKTEIRDAFRLGHYEENKTRPILVEFVTNSLRTAIFEKSPSLKGTGIAVSADYIQEDYLKRKFLTSQLKIVRAQGRTAQLKGHKLIIDNIPYTYEEIKLQNDQINSKGNTPSEERIQENRKREVTQEGNPKKTKNLRSNSKK